MHRGPPKPNPQLLFSLLQRRSCPPHVEVSITLGGAYLAYLLTGESSRCISQTHLAPVPIAARSLGLGVRDVLSLLYKAHRLM
jgi:hypothetical protein